MEDRSWIRKSKTSVEYVTGIQQFLEYAFRNRETTAIWCPCYKCNNNKRVNRKDAIDHLVCNGFIKNYTRWICHGEATSSTTTYYESAAHDRMPLHRPETSSSTRPSGSKTSQKKKRGYTRGLAILKRPPGTKLAVKWNSEGQPTGENGCSLTTHLACIAKNNELLPLTFDDWRAVDVVMKDSVWEYVLDAFDLDETRKEWVISNVSVHWRNWKNRLKNKYYKPNKNKKARFTACTDNRVNQDQWLTLVQYWDLPETEARSVQNTANRSHQEFTHTGGSRLNSCLREQIMQAEGREPSRCRIFIDTHKNKDDEPMSERVREIIEDMQLRASQLPENDQDTPGLKDIYSQVMGGEKRGYVRTFGFGVTPSQKFGVKPSRSEALRMASQREEEVQRLSRTVERMKDEFQDRIREQVQLQMEAMKAELLAELRSGAGPSGVGLDVPRAHSLHGSHAAPYAEGQPGTSSSAQPSTSTYHAPNMKCPKKRRSVENIERIRFVTLKSAATRKAVAKGTLLSTDPKTKVGNLELGNEFWKVQVEVPMLKKEPLIRPYGKLTTVGRAVGASVAWPRYLIDEDQG